MNYIPLIALCVSVAALVISGLAFWISWRAQHHIQIVSFEQRRQDVRQIFLEAQLIVGEMNDELNRAILMADEQVIVGKMNDELKRRILRNTKIVRDGIAEIAVIRHEYGTVLEELDQIPSSPSTQARLTLEQIGGAAIRMKNKEQALLKEVHDANQTIEDAIEEIRRDTSK